MNGHVAIAITVLLTSVQAFAVYSPGQGRFISQDPIEEEGGLNLYGFCGNDPINNVDVLGEAYFAFRALDTAFGRWYGVSWDNDRKRSNRVVGHEQLFFEDGKNPANIGFFDDKKDPIRSDNSNLSYENIHYKDGGWNDCVMREAVKSHMNPPKYSLLGWWGNTQYNCQNWAEDVRIEYQRLIQLPEIIKKCCPTQEEREKRKLMR